MNNENKIYNDYNINFKKTNNMKKEYIFLVLIFIILYLLYLILDYKYKEYKINSHINFITINNDVMKKDININKDILEHIDTNAYKEKTAKEELALMNKWEKVIYITNEADFNKFSKNEVEDVWQEPKIEKNVQDNMEIFEKWMYFLFKKDVR